MVADFEGGPDRWGEERLVTAHIKGLGVAVEHDGQDVGVAQEAAQHTAGDGSPVEINRPCNSPCWCAAACRVW